MADTKIDTGWYGNEGFVVNVGKGEDANSYFLHRGYACFASKYFDDLYTDLKRAIIYVDFSSEQPDVVHNFAHWLYPKWLQILDLEHQDVNHLEYVNKLLVFSEKYLIYDLVCECYNKIRVLLTPHGGGVVPAERIKVMYDEFGPQSSMVKSFYLRLLVQLFSAQETPVDVQFLDNCFEAEPEFATAFFAELRQHIKVRRGHPFHDRDLELYLPPPLVAWWGKWEDEVRDGEEVRSRDKGEMKEKGKDENVGDLYQKLKALELETSRLSGLVTAFGTSRDCDALRKMLNESSKEIYDGFVRLQELSAKAGEWEDIKPRFTTSFDEYHNVQRRSEKEEAKRIEIEEAKQIQNEEAKRIEIEEAKRIEIEEAKRIEIEEAKRIQNEEAERIQNEEAERIQNEEAERIENEEAKRIENEEAKRMSMIQSKAGGNNETIMEESDTSNRNDSDGPSRDLMQVDGAADQPTSENPQEERGTPESPQKERSDYIFLRIKDVSARLQENTTTLEPRNRSVTDSVASRDRSESSTNVHSHSVEGSLWDSSLEGVQSPETSSTPAVVGVLRSNAATPNDLEITSQTSRQQTRSTRNSTPRQTFSSAKVSESPDLPRDANGRYIESQSPPAQNSDTPTTPETEIQLAPARSRGTRGRPRGVRRSGRSRLSTQIAQNAANESRNSSPEIKIDGDEEDDERYEYKTRQSVTGKRKRWSFGRGGRVSKQRVG